MSGTNKAVSRLAAQVTHSKLDRRQFVKLGAAGLGLAMAPGFAFAQAKPEIRVG